jgi:hypothetical protein
MRQQVVHAADGLQGFAHAGEIENGTEMATNAAGRGKLNILQAFTVRPPTKSASMCNGLARSGHANNMKLFIRRASPDIFGPDAAPMQEFTVGQASIYRRERPQFATKVARVRECIGEFAKPGMREFLPRDREIEVLSG